MPRARRQKLEKHNMQEIDNISRYGNEETDDYDDYTPLEFEKGSPGELEKLLKLAFNSSPEFWERIEADSVDVQIVSKSDRAGSPECHVDVFLIDDEYHDNPLRLDEKKFVRFNSILAAVCRLNTFVGDTTEYNDNTYDFRPVGFQFNVHKPSNHEMAESAGVLREELSKLMTKKDAMELVGVA